MKIEIHDRDKSTLDAGYFSLNPILLPPVLRLSAELGRLPAVKTAASLVRGLCYDNKDKLLAGMIIAGWDPIEGGSVYEIPLGGTVMKQKFAIGGSGSTYMWAEIPLHGGAWMEMFN